VTDAIMSGLPPHIAQVICGHKNIDTTIGYKAVYPAEAIEAHRAFIARRRATRPREEYRTPTEEEWDAFLAHFEKRKVSIGTCARAFSTPCVHEHACVRCSLLRPDLAQRGRLEEIRDNLIARIAEAEREGWLGEVEGLKVSLAGARNSASSTGATGSMRPWTLASPPRVVIDEPAKAGCRVALRQDRQQVQRSVRQTPFRTRSSAARPAGPQ
jgi:hypothetical protein